MADDPDQVFESTESGASESYPIEAGQIRKGGFIMIKARARPPPAAERVQRAASAERSCPRDVTQPCEPRAAPPRATSCLSQGRPCKVSDVTSSKTGKHGHAKCHFVAIDIFTGKKARRTSPPPAARRQARLSGRSDTRQGLARGVCPAWPSPPLAVPASRRLPKRESSRRPAAPAAVRATR